MKSIENSKNFDFSDCNFENCQNVENIIINNDLNSIRKINLFLKSLYENIHTNQKIYITFENNSQRNNRLSKKYTVIFRVIDFFINRAIFKKGTFLNKYYRSLSTAEVMGRAIYNNFEINDCFSKNKKTIIIMSKTKSHKSFSEPSTNIILRLNRYGKDLKTFKLYKIRTMHIYSEFLQDYMVDSFGYTKKGKPNNDFRITSWGRIIRKLWLDELPQLLNLLKGDMKIFGVRPLSKSYMNEVPIELLKLRSSVKPGCVPPYVSLLKQSEAEYFISEKIYLDEYTNSKLPFLVDIKYLILAFKNIMLGKILSE